MRALVTGATGGLGRNLIERLHRDGHDIIATGRNTAIGKTITSSGIRFLPLDLSDKDRVIELVHGCDVIFHCAALSAPWGKSFDFWQTNLEGTRNVVDAAIRSSTKLVHISTPSIYARYKNQRDIQEDDIPNVFNMVNEYARSKRGAELVIRNACRSKGLNAIILRPRGIFGPHDNVLMPRLIATAERGAVPLINGGKAVVDVTYVDNAVDAMILAAETHDIKPGEAFNITNGQGVIISDLIRQALTAVGVPYTTKNVPYRLADLAARGIELFARIGVIKGEPALTRYTAGLFAFDQTLDITRARTILGYEPRISISEGIARYAEWYRLDRFRGQQG